MRKRVWFAGILACLIVLVCGAAQCAFADSDYSPLEGEAYSDEYVELMYACDTAYYGDSEIEFRAPFEGVTGEAVIGGKTYTLTYQGYRYNAYYGEFKHEYALRGIPVLPVGTEIPYTLCKGEVKYEGSVTVEKGPIDRRAAVYHSFKCAYNGKPVRPSVKVMFIYTYSDKYLNEGTDYKVTLKNNDKVGTATIQVTGINNYTGTQVDTFDIVPKGTTLSKVKAAKKGFTVKWKKQTVQTTGYQIQYGLKKSFKGAKTITISKNTASSKKIKKLKAKKKYYVRIRTFKNVNGKAYYSSWSKPKTVKTK